MVAISRAHVTVPTKICWRVSIVTKQTTNQVLLYMYTCALLASPKMISNAL